MTNKRASNPENLSTAEKVQLWARKSDSVSAADWISLGIARDISINAENTPLEHFANYRGARAKDREIITERKLSIDFTLEEFNIQNLKLAFGFGIADAATSGTKDAKFEKTVANPGAGVGVNLGQAGIKNTVVRSTSLEDDVTYVEDALDTDTGDDTDNGDFNNLTNPVVVAAADYPGMVATEGALIKIQNEIMRVSEVGGGNITLSRGQLGTTIATHADALDIFETGAGDYVVNETTGYLATVLGGDLDDVNVTEFHTFWEKELAVKKFEIFPGETVECQLQLQILGEGGAPQIYGPFENATLKNNGAIPVGDGSDWESIPMTAEVTVDGTGTFGDGAVVDQGELD